MGTGGKKHGGCLLMSCSYKSFQWFSPWLLHVEYQQLCWALQGTSWLFKVENNSMTRKQQSLKDRTADTESSSINLLRSINVTIINLLYFTQKNVFLQQSCGKDTSEHNDGRKQKRNETKLYFYSLMFNSATCSLVEKNMFNLKKERKFNSVYSMNNININISYNIK